MRAAHGCVPLILLLAGCAVPRLPAKPAALEPAPAAGAQAPPAAASRSGSRSAPATAAQAPRTLDRAAAKAAAHLQALKEKKAEGGDAPAAADLAGRYEALLSMPGTPNERKPEILLRLAELAYREEEGRLRSAYEAGRETEIPIAERYPRSVVYFRRLVDAYPESPQALTAFYNLGYLYAEEGKRALSAWAYEEVLRRDPKTPYADEIHMRLGEAAFDGDDVAAAIPHYRAVVEHGNPEYADKALYKLGWSFYNLDDFGKAIEAFSGVLDRGTNSPEDLRRETLEIMGRAFLEFGGAQGLDKYLGRHEQARAYGDRLYRQVGDLYASASRYEDAARTYAAGTDQYPESPECLALERGVLAAYLTLRDGEAATRRRESWLGRYGPGSAWDRVNGAGPLAAEGRALVEEGLRLAVLYRHSQAQRGQGSLGQALTLYEQYLAVYGSDTEAGYEVAFAYAQALKEAGRLEDAEAQYAAVASKQTLTSHREESSYRRIELLQSLYAKDPSRLDALLEAHERYAALNPDSRLVPEVLFAEAELCFAAERFPEARTVFRRVIALPAAGPKGVEALERIARCFFREGSFAEAEAAAREAIAARPPAELLDRAAKLVSFSVFKQAEEREAAGDREGANGHFFRLAEEFATAEVAEVALYRAAENLRALGKASEAAEVYGRLARRYKGSSYAKSALGISAELLSSLGDWKEAARNLEDLYRADPQTPEGAAALFQAGLAYEKAPEPAAAARIFAQFAASFPDDQRFAQAACREGSALLAQGLLPEARARFEAAWQSAAPEGEELYRAKAALALGDMALDVFRGVELRGDLETALTRKEELLDEALGHLANAATLPYGETITGALYRAGKAFEEMKEALLASERPAELTEEEKEQYDFLLEEKAAPLEEKSIAYYKKGIAAARTARLHTNWVDRMFARLEALQPWGYQRSEEPASAWTLPPLPYRPGGGS